jgi:hypothetical protein
MENMQNKQRRSGALNGQQLNRMLLEGHQIAIKRSGDEIVNCYIVGLKDAIPLTLFESYLASGWIEDVALDIRFAISAVGRAVLK